MLKKLEFKPDDFMSHDNMNWASAAEEAQIIFDKWYEENIEKAPIFYASKPQEDYWTPQKCIGDTHQAQIINIIAIKK